MVMTKITETIPKQNFEIIVDAIGSILTTEFAGQGVLQSSDQQAKKILEGTTVWKERFIIPQPNEDFVVIPFFFGADYQNQHIGQDDADNKYFIDFYGRAKASKKKTGDELSAIRLQRLVGIARYILRHDHYFDLGFSQTKIIRHHSIESIRRTEMDRQDEGTFISMYRMILNVHSIEETTLRDSEVLPISLHTTDVLVNETALGFQYQWVKP